MEFSILNLSILLSIFLVITNHITSFHITLYHAVIGGMLIDMLDEMVKAAKGKPVIIINPSLGKGFP